MEPWRFWFDAPNVGAVEDDPKLKQPVQESPHGVVGVTLKSSKDLARALDCYGREIRFSSKRSETDSQAKMNVAAFVDGCGDLFVFDRQDPHCGEVGVCDCWNTVGGPRCFCCPAGSKSWAWKDMAEKDRAARKVHGVE